MSDRFKMMMAGVLVLIGLFVGFFQTQRYLELQSLRADSDQEATELNADKLALLSRFQEVRGATEASRQEREQDLSKVFPLNEDITGLTRLFDDFAIRNNFSSNPFFISQLSYDQSYEDESVQVLPINISLDTSRKNLEKFLEYVNTSGSIQSGVRLMSTENVSMNYPSEFGASFSANIRLLAYFSRPL